MSVNIVQNGELLPIAGKTVPMPYTPAPQSMIGDAWVTSHAYAVGDYCIDGNVLYKCKTAHTSSASYRPPYASYWDAVSVASELKNAPNMLEFADYANFTAFTISTDNRCVRVNGGYKQVGRLVYMYYIFKPTSATLSFWTNGGGGAIANYFPKPAFEQWFDCICYPSKCTSIKAKLFVNSSNNSTMQIFATPNNTLDANTEIILKGIYISQ